jgi:hypothetical protein
VRPALAVVVGAATAALGALILGEYEFKGTTPYVAGVLFGLVVAEAVLTVARRGRRRFAVAAAAESAGGLLWAAWISAGRDWDYVPAAAWVAVALGAVVAAARVVRAGLRSSGPPAVDSRPGP